MTKRDPGLDILRSIAIILVMFRHYYVSDFMQRGGWIGVDLFFVLSGFLVSGLLFQEFKKRNSINAKLFLIRRGFKIYPSFWFVLILTMIYFSYKGIYYSKEQVLSELFFVQNFFPGIMGISWTLAIEEHFYILLTFAAVIASKKGWITNKKFVLIFGISVLVICLLLRVLLFMLYPFNSRTHFFPTYLRLDALMFGVLIS